MIVDNIPLNYGVSTMMQRVANGLISNDAITKLQPSMSKRELRTTNTSFIVKAEEVYSPHLIVPGINKGNHKVTLKEFDEPPYITRLPFGMLRDHALCYAPLS